MSNQYNPGYYYGTSGALPPYDDARRFSFFPVAGYSSGYPPIDMLLNMVMGGRLAPVPLPGTTQSFYDAFRMRDRNFAFIAAANQGLANNILFQSMGGVNTKSVALQTLSPFLAQPDNIFMKGLFSLIGGNPVRAQMGLLADLTTQTSSAFGMMGNISVPQTAEIMNQVYRTAYNYKTIRERFDPASGFTPANTISLEEYRRNALERGKALAGSNTELFRDFANSFSVQGSNSFQSKYGNEFNKDLGSLAERTVNRITQIQKDESLSTADKTRKIEDIRREAKDRADEFFKQMSSPEAVRKMSDAFKNAIEKGVDGVKQFKNQFGGDVSDLVHIQRRVEEMTERLGKNVVAGPKFDITRGFDVDDIVRSMAKAGDFRLVGKSGNYATSTTGYLTNAVGALDAARGLFGNNLSAQELVGSLNSFLGSSHFDITSSSGGKDLEDLLRKVKAASRVAGITVQSMMGIIEEGRMLALAHPGIRDIGGAALSTMGVETIATTTVLSQTMDNAWIRRMGNTVGIAQTQMAGRVLAHGEPITQQLAALYESFSQSGRSDIAGMISEYATSTSADKSRTGLNSFMQTVAAASGSNVYALRQFAQTSPNASMLGLARNPSLAMAPATSAIAEYEKFVGSRLGRAGLMALDVAFGDNTSSLDELLSQLDPRDPKYSVGRKALENVFARRQQGNMDLMSFNAVLQLPGGERFASYMQSRGYENNLRMTRSKRFAANYGLQMEFTKQSAAIDAEMDKEFAALRAKPITRIFSKFLDGSISTEGISSLLDAFKDPIMSEQYNAMEKNIYSLASLANNSDTSAGLSKYLTETGGLNTTETQTLLNAAKAETDVSGLKSGDPIKVALRNIDPYGELTEGRLTTKALKQHVLKRGLSNVMEARFVNAIRKHDRLANERFQAAIGGKGWMGDPSVLSEDLVKIRNNLMPFGVFDSDGNLIPERYHQLETGLTDEAKDFRTRLNNLQGMGFNSEAISKLNQVMSERNENVAAYRIGISSLVGGDSNSIEGMINNLNTVINNMGKVFSEDFVSKIEALIQAVQAL